MRTDSLSGIKSRLSGAKPLVIGHRGYVAPPDFPENTLPAFQEAFGKGADGIELDLQLTRDNQIIIFHDWNLKRLWNQSLKISDTDFPELENFVFKSSNGKSSVKIPRLKDLFREFGSSGYFNLELKTRSIYPNQLVKSVLETIEAFHLENRVWISSFHPLVPGICKKVNPEIVTGFLFSHWNYWTKRMCRKEYVDVLHPDVVLKDKMPDFGDIGKPLVFWSVNEPLEIENLSRQNRIHLITDNIELCRKIIETQVSS